MRYERLIVNLSFKKPITDQQKAQLPLIKTALTWLVSYCEHINEGMPNEENTTLVSLIDDATHWRATADLAMRLPLPQAVIDKLPEIRQGLRWLKGQADPKETVRVGLHICHHPFGPCEPERAV